MEANRRSPVPFTKMQSAGNDFVLLDIRGRDDRGDFAVLARSLCDRSKGVGGDGLIVLTDSRACDARMLFYNPDGTFDMCGNGLLCVGRYLAEAGVHGSDPAFHSCIETEGRIVPGRTAGQSVTVTFPYPAVQDKNLIMRAGERRYKALLVDAGTPHLVAFVDILSDVPLHAVAARQGRVPPYFQPMTFDFAVVVAPDYVKARVWERGVGETLACGTGAVAVSLAGIEAGVLRDDLTVEMPGGVLRTHWNRAERQMLLTGSPEIVFHGEVEA